MSLLNGKYQVHGVSLSLSKILESYFSWRAYGLPENQELDINEIQRGFSEGAKELSGALAPAISKTLHNIHREAALCLHNKVSFTVDGRITTSIDQTYRMSKSRSSSDEYKVGLWIVVTNIPL